MDDLLRPLRVVSALDDALDLERMDLEQYVKTRDEALVVTLTGKRPVWYTIRALNLYDVEFVTSLPEGRRGRAAFEGAISLVEGCDALSPEGSGWRPRHEVENALGEKQCAPTRDDMQKLFLHLGLDRLNEIGFVALERAALGNGVRGAPLYTVPPLFLPALDRSAALRRAARTRASAATETTAPQP